MKRIRTRKHQNPISFINELKEVQVLNNYSSEVPEEVEEKATEENKPEEVEEKATEENKPEEVEEKATEEVEEKATEEVEEKATEEVEEENEEVEIKKQSISIKEKKLNDNCVFIQKNDHEINTVPIKECIYGFEECIFEVIPKKKKEIKNILTANIILPTNCDCQCALIQTKKNSFSLLIKNNEDKILNNIKIVYHVIFE